MILSLFAFGIVPFYLILHAWEQDKMLPATQTDMEMVWEWRKEGHNLTHDELDMNGDGTVLRWEAQT